MLTERIVTLSERNAELERAIAFERDCAESFGQEKTAETNAAAAELGDLRLVYNRMKGWQDCAREILCNLMVAPVASDKS
jgi:hypothetical protein